jgi:hypothetical protein
MRKDFFISQGGEEDGGAVPEDESAKHENEKCSGKVKKAPRKRGAFCD